MQPPSPPAQDVCRPLPPLPQMVIADARGDVKTSGSVVDVTGVWSVAGEQLILTGDISASAPPHPDRSQILARSGRMPRLPLQPGPPAATSQDPLGNTAWGHQGQRAAVVA